MTDHPSTSPRRLRTTLLPLFVFFGSFLMFVLEPMVGRLLLPSFGGGFHVWTTCLMFFQGALLVGYAYAHLLAPRIGRWHVAVACLPLVLLPIGVDPQAGGSELVAIVVSLIRGIAIPFGVLATTGVVAQSWLAESDEVGSDNPYYLYAASNAGSLLGLLAYPFAVEPFFGVATQQITWTCFYLVYLVLAFVVAPRAAGPNTESSEVPAPAEAVTLEASPGAGRVGYWLLLSMAPSVMLMAVTNAISNDVGSIPLAWVAPLALYLTTFILIFRDTPWYPTLFRRYWPEFAVSGLIVLSAWILFPNWPRILWHLVVLFALCMCGHGELYRSRPAPRYLTAYYLVVAAGGFAGGVFVSLIVPRIFTQLHEYGVAIVLLSATLAVGRRRDLAEWMADGSRRLERLVRVPVNFAAVGLSFVLLLPGAMSSDVLRLRNHYGTYQVADASYAIDSEGSTTDVPLRYLVHNGTTHGIQLLAEADRRSPTAYYHPRSPLGDALSMLEGDRRVGIIGLGAGGTAPYFDGGDEVVYYEIDPDSERIAREHFSYLADCEADLRVVIGDARLEIARDPRAPDGYFDYLIVDAFSGDAIPTHILTKEALELYASKIKDGGALIFNISNRFYDLRKVLAAGGKAIGLDGAYKFRSDDDLGVLELKSRWYVLSNDRELLDRLIAEKGWTSGETATATARPWTDDYVNILGPLVAEVFARR